MQIRVADSAGMDCSMLRISVLYVIFSGLLTAYLGEILAPQESIGKITFAGTFFLVTGLALSTRLLLLRRHEKTLEVPFQKDPQRLISLPFRELRSDLILWILLGSVLGALIGGSWWTDWKTTLQLLCSSLMIGLMIGALNFLQMEKDLILFSREHGGSIAIPQSQIKISVAAKIAVLLYSIMAVAAVFIGFMVFDEASDIIGKCANLPRPQLRRMIFEISGVCLAVIVVSIWITRRFTTNLNLLLGLQIDTLAKVETGAYDTAVPVVTRDEFGIIAAHTNEMITGLRDREHIREIFGKYMSKEIRDVILSTGSAREAETRNVTILFCDLRGFTSFVERNSPQQVVQKLNQYYTEMVQAIEERQGLVLQFIGDEIEAVFGAPIVLEDHPSVAVEAAIEMRKRLSDLNRKWEAQGDSPFQHGIGIHSGEVLAASVGSPERLSYLMVGDTVNLASRIQSMTKDLGCDILISGQTRRFLPETFSIQYLRTVKVRGRKEETELFMAL